MLNDLNATRAAITLGCEWVKWMSEEWNHPNNRIQYRTTLVCCLVSLAVIALQLYTYRQRHATTAAALQPFIQSFNHFHNKHLYKTMCIVLCGLCLYAQTIFHNSSRKIIDDTLLCCVLLLTKCGGWWWSTHGYLYAESLSHTHTQTPKSRRNLSYEGDNVNASHLVYYTIIFEHPFCYRSVRNIDVRTKRMRAREEMLTRGGCMRNDYTQPKKNTLKVHNMKVYAICITITFVVVTWNTMRITDLLNVKYTSKKSFASRGVCVCVLCTTLLVALLHVIFFLFFYCIFLDGMK